MAEISRALTGLPLPDIFQTSLNYSDRVLSPFERSDLDSLTFAMSALVLSAIFSLFDLNESIEKKKAKTEATKFSSNTLNYPSFEENEIFEKTFQNNVNRKGILYSKGKNDLSKIEATGEKRESLSLKDYEKTLIAFEDFMKWTQNETSKQEPLLENLLHLAISKTRGKKIPSDDLIDLGLSIYYDIVNKIETVLDYLFW